MKRKPLLIVAAATGLAAIILGFLFLFDGLHHVTDGTPPPPRHGARPPEAGRELQPPPWAGENADELLLLRREVMSELTPRERFRVMELLHTLNPQERRELFGELVKLEHGARGEHLRELLSERPRPGGIRVWPLALILIGSTGGALALYSLLSRPNGGGGPKGTNCPHCGRPVEDDWRFCPYCTEPLRSRGNEHQGDEHDTPE
ncbi:MAG: zinc-ribbon domain-containing protein [Candidatus Coatesbacteria bacterium]|nr:zinc-ribbon domain-containing protein [Candidatus Coatesbacteria bacterium]